jgi:DNA-binding NarL/FixJ family response regulator
MKRHKVAIVDSATVVAEGIAAILSRSPRAEVVGIYRHIAEIESIIATGRIDVVVASVAQYHEIEATTSLNNIPVVGMQSSLIDEDIVRRFNATITLYTSVEDVERIVAEAAEQPSEHNISESHELSDRERDVLVLVARGFTNKEIASELNISPHTVISHRKNIVHKTGIRSVAGLTVYAVLNKLVDNELI